MPSFHQSCFTSGQKFLHRSRFAAVQLPTSNRLNEWVKLLFDLFVREIFNSRLNVFYQFQIFVHIEKHLVLQFSM